jgi:YD repeat-containing protein
MKKIINLLSYRFFLPILIAASSATAQVGNDNPTGVAGAFGPIITTSGSYSPYTGNAVRALTDLSVASGVGAYPLVFSRIYNSRMMNQGPFAPAGWQHSYQWELDDPNNTGQPDGVSFPDGRYIAFSVSGSDIYRRGPAGIRERFKPFDGTNLGYLIFPDGGKVEFQRNSTAYWDFDYNPPRLSYWYTYQAKAIIDPFGQRTNFTYNTDGTLQKVTEPGGRWIQLTYTTTAWNDKVISQVSSSDGRSVQYYYTHNTYGSTAYTVLDHVVYFGDSSLTAQYRYCVGNLGSGYGPLLWTCDDPMYGGPMKKIGYVYKTTNNQDGSGPVYGQILSENYYDGTNVGAAVSTLTVNGSTRTERRGDGTQPTRTFTYTGYKLTSETDFRGVTASQTYNSNGYVVAVTDRRGKTTDFTVNALNGAVLTATFPSTPGDTPPNTPRGVVTTTFGWASCPDPNNRDANNPYYPYSVTDEGNHTIIFTRDSSKRVTSISYPDGGSESFTYNTFGQVLTHVLTTGGTESFTYDASGSKLTYRNPSNATGNPTERYSFDGNNRVSGVTDVLGTSTGDVNHTAWPDPRKVDMT